MPIFQTERLTIRPLTNADANDYFDMMGNFEVMKLIPRKAMSREESDAHLNEAINKDIPSSELRVWAIEQTDSNTFIGICAFLKNDNNDDEIGYRLRQKFWRKGYGTEVTKGLISFGFNEFNMTKIAADVNIANANSVRILDRFFRRKVEFFNPEDNCTDRRYEVLKEDWVKNNS